MAKKKTLKDTIKEGIEKYTGRPVSRLDTFEDSVGAIALRAHMGDREQEMTFLIAAFDVPKCTSAEQVDRYLEEAEFGQWLRTTPRCRSSSSARLNRRVGSRVV